MRHTDRANTLSPTLNRLQSVRPLVHCLTNEVVQEITANVLLAAGASPAMVVGKEEAYDFAQLASALLINLGTPYPERLESMRLAIAGAKAANRPWVLDPVAAGATRWRDQLMQEFLALRPTVIRGNASEIRALAGLSSSGKGVDAADSTESAIEAAKALSYEWGSVVFITGAVDRIVEGDRVEDVAGGVELTTLVVGTGCALSALTAAYVAIAPTPFEGAMAAALHTKLAAEEAFKTAKAPGSFHAHFIDALFSIAQTLKESA